MAKWFGVIGFGESREVRPGVWRDEITERTYRGDLVRNTRRLQTADQLNDNITITNEISIVADPFVNGHIHEMRYASFAGTKWKITNVDASQRPRLILTLGGEWHGQST